MAAMRITELGTAPVVVVFSKAKLPVNVWPAMLRLTPMASTRRNGPAGSVSAIVSFPMLKFSATAAPVLLMEIFIGATSDTDDTFCSVIVALT